MNKVAYFDCSSGISGDMCLGALVDAGLPLRVLEDRLRALPVKGYALRGRKVRRSSVSATKVDVLLKEGRVSACRTWEDVRHLIEQSSLPVALKVRGTAVFKRLFQAEGKVHGRAYTKTHLHELGAVDCLVDIFGTLIGLDYLGVGRIHSSPVNLGSGSVKTAHGRLPVPAPATAELLRGMSVYASDTPFELTTPTGAALLRELAGGEQNMPLMRLEKTGGGAGGRDLKEAPNILRIFIGEEIVPARSGGADDRITVLETNIDDMNPQVYEYVMAQLFAAGALDVYLTQVIMKKGRPGIVLTVLCRGEDRASLSDILFRETTTIGIRYSAVSRSVLPRRIAQAEVAAGPLRIKTVLLPDGSRREMPEYEDCAREARRSGAPLLTVMGTARAKGTSGKAR